VTLQLDGLLRTPRLNGKEGWLCIHYPGVVGRTLLLPLLLEVHVCNVCKGRREIEELLLLILWARPVCWVSLRLCTTCSARLDFRVLLDPVLVACHRFKSTQANPLYLPEILMSERALNWPACTNKPPGPRFEVWNSVHAGHAHCSATRAGCYCMHSSVIFNKYDVVFVGIHSQTQQSHYFNDIRMPLGRVCGVVMSVIILNVLWFLSIDGDASYAITMNVIVVSICYYEQVHWHSVLCGALMVGIVVTCCAVISIRQQKLVNIDSILFRLYLWPVGWLGRAFTSCLGGTWGLESAFHCQFHPTSKLIGHVSNCKTSCGHVLKYK